MFVKSRCENETTKHKQKKTKMKQENKTILPATSLCHSMPRILRSTDGADPLGAGGGGTLADAGPASFLDEDLSGVDTSLPLVKEKIYPLLVAKIEKVATKDNTGELIKIQLKLEEDAVDTNGNHINKGFPIFHSIPITPSENYSKDDIKRKVAEFVQAAGGQRIFPLSTYENAKLFAKVTIQKERTDKNGTLWPARNAIGRFLKPSEIKGS
jgi:hypothetical protein